MSEQFIICPNCKTEIPLTDAITHQLQEKVSKEFEGKFKERESLLTERSKNLEQKEKEIENSQKKINETVKNQLEAERQKLRDEVIKEISKTKEQEWLDIQKQLEEKENKIKDFQKQELDLRRQNRKLKQKEEQLDLELQRKLDEERDQIKDEALKNFQEQYQFKAKEKDKLINDLKERIEEMKRKAELGSQQLQGEILELELEDFLRLTFPGDKIEPVAKGKKGGDVVQKVYNERRQYCGTILWESKRHKNWSDNWIEKLKDDQREIKAEIGVILSTVLPKDIDNFTLYQGVWVTNYPSVSGLATALRLTIIQVANSNFASEGKNEKMELLYNYLTGSEFQQRINGILTPFVNMKKTLDQEKRAMEKIWAKREKQIERVIKNISGMSGEFEAIISGSFPEVEGLQLKAIEEGKS